MTLAPRGSLPAILRGMVLIARGRAEGLNCFGDSPKAFLISLTPGLGFIVGGLVEGLSDGEGTRLATGVLVPLCALLAPAVLSHELARFWGRDAFWGRYIVVFNWCQWLLPVIASVLLAAFSAANAAGAGGIEVLIVGLAGYALWMNWFIARNALALTAGRAAAFVALINLGTMILVFGPSLLLASTK